MIAIKNEQYVDELKKRRGEIMRILAHVQREEHTLDKNTEWMDRAAYESRCHLLDKLG